MGLKKYCYDGSKKFDIKKFDTNDTGEIKNREDAVKEFVNNLEEINKLQQKLYADRREGVIFVFQAMDAAGKDGVIRTVFSTLSPHGVREYCFKAPSTEELSHDFLWRFWNALPAKGHISIFNRSYYEDVLVGKVHKLYKNQLKPSRLDDVDIIKQRYESICDYEKYLYNTGTRVVKIFLNVSKDEQGKRFISRIDTPRKNWKISVGDIEERGYWDDYMDAFEKMINTTATDISPWYVVPSDHKWFARLLVSRIVLETLKEMKPEYPVSEDKEKLLEIRKQIFDSMKNKDLVIDKGDELFSSPITVIENMFIREEKLKENKRKNEIKKNCFDAVREMIDSERQVTSVDDIVNAVIIKNSKISKLNKK